MRWVYVLLMNWWTYPETDVTILDEDMPDELRPPRQLPDYWY